MTVTPKPLTVTETTTRVVKAGNGAAVKGDEIVSLRYVLLNGKDGKELDTNYGKANLGLNLGGGGPAARPEEGPGQPEGRLARARRHARPRTRSASRATPTSRWAAPTPSCSSWTSSATEPLTTAEGKAVKPAAGLPDRQGRARQGRDHHHPQGCEAADQDRRPSLLIEGTGAKVAAGQTVRVTYTGALVEGRQELRLLRQQQGRLLRDRIGQQQVITAWDEPLVGKTVGSRVLMVVPPADGYGAAGSPPKISGTDTLVFVVDILAALTSTRPAATRRTAHHHDPPDPPTGAHHGFRPQHDQARDRLPRRRRPQPSSSSRTSPRVTARRPAPATPSRPTTSASRTPPARSSTPRGTAARRWTSGSASARSSAAGTRASSA